eukprot:s845_g19.t1
MAAHGPSSLRGRPVHMFLLAGQSNMSGRGELPEFPEEKDERLLVLGSDGTWKTAQHPLHYDKPEKAGVGPGLAFARGVVDFLPAPVGLLPCAFGGSEIQRWLADGDLFKAAVAKVERGRALGGVLRGILWHQGESDSASQEDASQYAQRLREALRQLRLACGCADAPIIVGELGMEFLVGDSFAFVETVNKAIIEIGEGEPNTSLVSSAGLRHKGDRLHFCSRSANELGRRYAWRWLEMTGHVNLSLRTLVGSALDPRLAGRPDSSSRQLQVAEGYSTEKVEAPVLD